MAKGARKKPDVYPAPKITKETLETLSRVLILVGKPFYLLLSFAVISFLFVAFTLGHSSRILFEKITTRIPQLPDVRITFSVLVLKIKLLFVKLSSRILPTKLPKLRLRLNSALLSLLFLTFSIVFLFWYKILRDLPSPYDLINRDIEVSTKIYDRNGVLLYKIYKDKNRTPVALSEIPLTAHLATMAIEDAEFYSHTGFSIKGIARATLRNIQKGELTGGSTITQQLVKNALLTPQKTLTRKSKEITLAILVEANFSKDEILEMYLNEVSYGGTAYGIQEASRVYFGKDVGKLTLSEAALLAGLPKCPTKCSPFGPNPETSLSRQKEVLRLMKVNGFITREQQEEAEKQKLTFAENRIDMKAPHFVMYVREKLVEKYGEEVVETGGLEVVTTLDYQIQKVAEETVKSEVDKLSRLNVRNGAAIVLAPKTGEILAMVGSKDYFDTAQDGNVNVTTRLNSPGSSIKVVNYAYALSNGFTAGTIIPDTPVTFSVAGQPPYTPKNYDGEYRGNITLRSALAESRNITAVRTLASYGVSKMLEMGRKMGITSWQSPSDYGLSLTLGGGDITLLELARVYTTVANYGKRPEITSVISVKNYKGKVLETASCTRSLVSSVSAAEAATSVCKEEQVLDPRVAFILIDILRDNNARSPSFGRNSMLVVPNHSEVAVKTGTSNNLRDNLTVGFNQNYLTAVWVGNNDNSEMSRIASGVTGAAPIWNKIMNELLKGQSNHPWDIPVGLVQLPVCVFTGTLPCENCPTKTEWFLEENKPAYACSQEQLEKVRGKIIEPAAKAP